MKESLKPSPAPPPSSAPEPSSPSTPAPPPGSAPATAPAAVSGLLAGLVLRLGRIVDEEGVEGKGVGEDVVADGGAADVDRVEGDWVAAARGHFDGAQGGVHLRGDGGDGAVEDGSCC